MNFLFFGAHPDDVEMSCAGTILRLKKAGHWVGICDLTKGEMGSRGTVETRNAEAQKASKLLSLDYRTNLGLPDAHLSNNTEAKKLIVDVIREQKPDFVFCNAPKDRHIDHGVGHTLVKEACFLSGLVKYENEENLKPHRPINVISYIQDEYLQPNLVVDITAEFNDKMSVVYCYKTQFHQEKSTGPVTPISTPEFMEFFSGRASQMGRLIQTRFGEGFIAENPLNPEFLNWFD